MVDARAIMRWYPLPFVLLLAARLRKKSAPPLPIVSVPDLVACGLLLALATVRAHVEGTDDWYLHGGDAAFHAGNAAELLRRWPMQDPRIAGEPLTYHFFSYAFPCVQSLVLGVPVRPGLFGTGAALLPIGFALAAFGAARSLGARTW